MTCTTERLFCVEQWYGRCVLVSDIVRAVFKNVCLSTSLDVGFSNEIQYSCTNEGDFFQGGRLRWSGGGSWSCGH